VFGRLLTIAFLVAAGYWYWSGPYQEQRNPSAGKKLEKDIEDMRQCVRGMNYKSGATGESGGNPDEICAEKFNLYFYEGEWRSIDQR
jgi:hypothetical protein